MINSMEQSKIKYLYLLSFVFIFITVSGCAGPKIAADLLVKAEKNDKPLVSNAVTIDVKINPAIHNYEKIDESVKDLLFHRFFLGEKQMACSGPISCIEMHGTS